MSEQPANSPDKSDGGSRSDEWRNMDGGIYMNADGSSGSNDL